MQKNLRVVKTYYNKLNSFSNESNLILKEIYMVNNKGQKQDLYRSFTKLGNIEKETHYKISQIDGFYKEYHENGKLKLETHYKNSQLNGVYKMYYENGQIQIQTNYKNNKLNGIYEEYHENSKLKLETHYKNGQLNGIYKMYYENGKLKLETHYKNGQLNGVCKKYDRKMIKGKQLKIKNMRNEQAFLKQIDHERREKVKELLLSRANQNTL